jgi:hypothetical protein
MCLAKMWGRLMLKAHAAGSIPVSCHPPSMKSIRIGAGLGFLRRPLGTGGGQHRTRQRAVHCQRPPGRTHAGHPAERPPARPHAGLCARRGAHAAAAVAADAARGVRFVCNAGGLNPHGAAQAVLAALAAKGWRRAWRWCPATTCCRGCSTRPRHGEFAHLFTGEPVAACASGWCLPMPTWARAHRAGAGPRGPDRHHRARGRCRAVPRAAGARPGLDAQGGATETET